MTSVGFTGTDLLAWAPLEDRAWQSMAQVYADAAKAALATPETPGDMPSTLGQWTSRLRELQSVMTGDGAQMRREDLLVFVGAAAAQEHAADIMKPRLELVTSAFDHARYTASRALADEMPRFLAAWHGAASAVSAIIERKGRRLT